MQKSLFPQNQLQSLPLVDAKVQFLENWLDSTTADQYFEHFHQHLAWQEGEIKIFGKTSKIPRLQAWYGDEGTEYQYSGVTMQPRKWTHQLVSLKKQCEALTGVSYNSVLANLYRDGSDGMGMHSDNEPELGVYPTIVSVSLGETRNFDFKHRISGEKYRLPLSHGSVLVMSGATQEYWLHGIAKTKKAQGARINLTFREIKRDIQK